MKLLFIQFPSCKARSSCDRQLLHLSHPISCQQPVGVEKVLEIYYRSLFISTSNYAVYDDFVISFVEFSILLQCSDSRGLLKCQKFEEKNYCASFVKIISGLLNQFCGKSSWNEISLKFNFSFSLRSFELKIFIKAFIYYLGKNWI